MTIAEQVAQDRLHIRIPLYIVVIAMGAAMTMGHDANQAWFGAAQMIMGAILLGSILRRAIEKLT